MIVFFVRFLDSLINRIVLCEFDPGAYVIKCAITLIYIEPCQTADGSHLANVTDEEMQEHYDNFFEDVFVECEDKYGQVLRPAYFLLDCLFHFWDLARSAQTTRQRASGGGWGCLKGGSPLAKIKKKFLAKLVHFQSLSDFIEII